MRIICKIASGSLALLAQEAEALGSGYMGSPGREGDDLMKEVILLAACGAGEVLPQSPDLPADVFTACLTTPIKVSWHKKVYFEFHFCTSTVHASVECFSD